MSEERTPYLHELNPTRRFSDRAAEYRLYRPDYPEAAIDTLIEGRGDPARLVAADAGAGTGIASRQLAARGVRVIAIEPNAEMRAAAEPHPLVEWRDGTAEATGLPDGSVGLVLAATAFHWFRPREALHEFHRVLIPGGRLALLWNTRDRADPLTVGYIAAVHQVHGEHPAERRRFDPAVVAAAAGEFSPPRLLRIPHAQPLDRAGLIGRALSASYVPREGPGFVELTALLDALWRRHHDERGLVTMRYVTEVYLSERS
jgi:SAM-dependent methyltransferase